ncbi:hypothetical protein [Blastococcus sp. CT_GayMR16]|uniref:hypothetical protein n=1 Tax=Blastococcus sp. CT_GayMR16 TaxID=2559607 RepID=UPI001074329D|nr:hypothetical protein [Blastococcus sp. CT_GayMR16]TFV91229.1 hypothetical protein E4P38_01090 [Blastococcus sp. CT_GayMR16]
MIDPPQHDRAPDGTAAGGEDRTRDIRLPSLPGRPPSAMPREWAEVQPRPSSPASGDLGPSAGDPAETPDFSAPPPETSVTHVATPARPRGTPLVDQPTDELPPPPGPPRERTIAFASPEMAGGRPAPSVGRTPRRPRRWPWVVLTLLPILVIVGAGIAWLLLLRGA